MKRSGFSLAGWACGWVLAGGVAGMLAGGGVGTAAEPGAPVRETAEDAPDPAVALMKLVSEGGVDQGRAAELLPLLQAGSYREALRVNGEMEDERMRAATGRFIWQRWLALDRDTAFRSLLELRGAGEAVPEADGALAWLVSGRLYADRVTWAGKALAGTEDVGLRQAILAGMAETWLVDGDATGEELLAKSAWIPAPARREILVRGCAMCCQDAAGRLNNGDMTNEKAAGVIAGVRRVIGEVAPDGGADGGEIFTRFPLPGMLGKLTGLVLGPGKALTVEPLPAGFRGEFVEGIGMSAAGMKPAQVLRLQELPLEAWAGYIGARRAGFLVDVYAEDFKELEMTEAQLEVAAKGALVSEISVPCNDGSVRRVRQPDDVSPVRIEMILKLKEGAFRSEVIRQAAQVLREQGKEPKAADLLRKVQQGK